MEKSPYESMSGDTKDKTEVQSWEEIVQAIQNIMDTNLSEDKLVTLKNLNQRKVPPPIISVEWREWAEESKKLLTKKLQPSESNLCLLSLAIFPENSIIKKRILILGEKTAEQVGEEVYNELLQQGLIEPDDNDASPLMNRCKRRPLIHYRLISEVEEARLFYFESKDKTSHEDLKNLSSSHLRLIVDEHVHMVFNVNQQYIELQSSLLSNIKQLAVLQLGRWKHSPNYHIEVDEHKLLDDLGVHHKHLTFLSLQGISRITALPNSIVELVSLEILDLRACHNLEKLPENIASLKKLTRLDISECYLIERMPKGTEKLSSLQVLKGFVIGTARKNHCRISNLRKLTKLRRLSICIGRGAAIGAGEFASLKEVASPGSLTISWGVTSPTSQSSLSEDQFLPNQLEKLELIGMPMASISKCLNPQELENLKKLSLRIKNNEDVLKKFPRLKYFEKINCADDNVLWYKCRAV
ncbi:hypothetical protein ACJRO7_004098 [Eucalyptus globulus]|uniref:Disease resistance R13L4/SHOC-2-like LRR domain-containing protein n=1 Tax=Eucalyptus globulus TaxID=34317 RepID=A0ABD3IZ16_EUCGL